MNKNVENNIKNNKKNDIQKIIEKMTAEEKIGQLINSSRKIERLGIAAYDWWNEGLHGVARAGKATVFPQAINLSASFDFDLIRKIGKATGREAAAKYAEFRRSGDCGMYKGLTLWAPNINIVRDPRWGRSHETYGEDPFLSGETGAAFIRGIQNKVRYNGKTFLTASACVKHLAAYSGPEELRHDFNAVVSARDLEATYLPAFEKCVRAGVTGVMAAYNKLNGTPCSSSEFLLKDVLRRFWGFKGYTVADCGAVSDSYNNHTYLSPESAAAAALNAGCDMDCGGTYLYLSRALERGITNMRSIDDALYRAFVIKDKLGLLRNDRPPFDYKEVACKKHLKLSRKASEKGLVLLKNNGVLPFSKGEKIALIGANADNLNALYGNYYGTCTEHFTPLEGFNAANLNFEYAEGCGLYKEPDVYSRGSMTSEALIAADKCSAIVLCLGKDNTAEGEEGDPLVKGGAENYDLSENQFALISLLRNKFKDKPIVLVLFGACAAGNLRHFIALSDAVIWAGYDGPYTGLALTDLLTGKINPLGRLPFSFYKDFSLLPDRSDYSMKDRTYRYCSNNILFPFGAGLSYAPTKSRNLAFIKKQKQKLVFSALATGAKGTPFQLYASCGEVDMPIRELKAVSLKKTDGDENLLFQVKLSDMRLYRGKKTVFQVFDGQNFANAIEIQL